MTSLTSPKGYRMSLTREQLETIRDLANRGYDFGGVPIPQLTEMALRSLALAEALEKPAVEHCIAAVRSTVPDEQWRYVEGRHQDHWPIGVLITQRCIDAIRALASPPDSGK